MAPSDTDLIASALWTGEPDKGRVYHHADVSEADRNARYGIGEIEMPSSIVAGDPVDVRFSFKVGATTLGPGSALRVAWRWPFDWADLQLDAPSSSNHLSVSATSEATLETRFEHRGDLNPWHHDIDIRVQSGSLSVGDTIAITCTDWDGPTFSTTDGYFLMLINPEGGNDWVRLTDPPRFTVAPGTPDRLIAIAPADGYVGERTTLRVRAVDAWENPTPVSKPSLNCPGATLGDPDICDGYPVWEFPVEWTSEGVQRIEVSADGLSCQANPSHIHSTEPTHRIFWGDLHAGQSEIGCGAGSLDNHYAYARDVAGLQFASQQANDHYITKALWDHVRAVTPRYQEDGRFLAYLGCEWSPYTEDGGDRNVIYMTDEHRMRRSDRFFLEHSPDAEPDLTRAPEFLEAFRSEDVLLNLHVGGRPTNLEWHAPEVEPLFEVHSTHATSEWFLFDAIRRGYKVGVTAGTDGVMGRPGACGSGRRVTRNVRNGLTAVSARSLTQRDVANGFFERRCYGTTGARILLEVAVNGHPMGSSVSATGPVRLHVQAEGTEGIERIDFFRDTECLESLTLSSPDPDRYRILFGGAKEEGTAAAQRQVWDGRMTVLEGTIGDVVPVGFQCPLNTVSRWDAGAEWELATAGNDMGFTFTFENTPEGIEVTTPILSFEFAYPDLDSPATVSAGGVERRAEVGPAPSPDTPRSASVEFVDSTPLPGEHPYWIRVTQVDRERAWSSPIYVTH